MVVIGEFVATYFNEDAGDGSFRPSLVSNLFASRQKAISDCLTPLFGILVLRDAGSLQFMRQSDFRHSPHTANRHEVVHARGLVLKVGLWTMTSMLQVTQAGQCVLCLGCGWHD